jgi:hypothetical protein
MRCIGTEFAPWHIMRLHLGGSRRWLGCPGCGRSDFAQFHKASFARTRAEGVTEGFASEQNYDTAITLMDDPATLYYSNPVFTARGRRPGSWPVDAMTEAGVFATRAG